jgi:hypothetical protein
MGVGILYSCTPCLFSIGPDRLTRNPQSAIRNWKG